MAKLFRRTRSELMANSRHDPQTKTFSVKNSGAYVQVYQYSPAPPLADVNFFDGVKDVEDLKKMKLVMEEVIEELERRQKG